MRHAGHSATRAAVLEAIDRLRPFGPELATDKLIVLTAQEYPTAPGMPRVAVFRRSDKVCLYSGGSKGSNYQAILDLESMVAGKATGPSPIFPGLEDSGRLYYTMCRRELSVMRDLADRLEWWGLEGLSKRVRQLIENWEDDGE